MTCWFKLPDQPGRYTDHIDNYLYQFGFLICDYLLASDKHISSMAKYHLE